jgi:hypothetical protein
MSTASIVSTITVASVKTMRSNGETPFPAYRVQSLTPRTDDRIDGVQVRNGVTVAHRYSVVKKGSYPGVYIGVRGHRISKHEDGLYR